METAQTARVLAGRYVLGRRLGRGGMGEVLAAHDLRLDREVAVKLLDAGARTRPDARTRFVHEARAAGALRHPNIVAVHDFGEDAGELFLVMERLPGTTLADVLAAGPLPPARAAEVLLDVLAGLGAAHAAGVLHRDIKPGNVLLADDGRARLADFGIATSGGTRLTRTGEVIGTPSYLAPERLAGEPATVRSDVYSVGVLGYEMLTGAVPFGGATPVDVAYAIHRGRPDPLRSRAPGVPRPLARAVERAMAREPADRYPSTVVFTAALGPLAPGSTGATRTLPTAAAPVPRARRRTAVAAAALAAAGVGLAVVLGGPSGDPAPAPQPRSEATLPAGLERAFTRLEKALEP